MNWSLIERHLFFLPGELYGAEYVGQQNQALHSAAICLLTPDIPRAIFLKTRMDKVGVVGGIDIGGDEQRTLSHWSTSLLPLIYARQGLEEIANN